MTALLNHRRPAHLFTRASKSREKDGTSPLAPPRLQTFSDLPTWYQDNPYILTHYRPVSYSHTSCLYSWTYLHNESLNIYTHLIPAVLSLFAQLYTQRLLAHHFPLATLSDRLVFALHILAATTALTLSTTYHTLLNHSVHVSALWLRLDYAGILALILGSFISGIYVGFYEHPHLRTAYWGMISALSIAAAVLVLGDRFQGPRYRSVRTAAFVLTALSGLAPLAHGLRIYGWSGMWVRGGMPYWLGEGAMYGVGAAL
jgi:adiponectin receptor